MVGFCYIDVGTSGTGDTRAPHFSQIIRQNAPLQLKKLLVFVYEGTPEYMCPLHFLNASYAPVLFV